MFKNPGCIYVMKNRMLLYAVLPEFEWGLKWPGGVLGRTNQVSAKDNIMKLYCHSKF
jgi:hypothetical protein